jgi:uracil-DNA glycosylase
MTDVRQQGGVRSSELERLHERIAACRACELAGMSICKPAAMDRGRGLAKVMAVGIAPGRAAATAGKAFAGSSMARLLGWLSDAGLATTEERVREAIYFTSLNKCGVTPDSQANRQLLWRRCRPFLLAQLELMDPDLILLFGKEPVDALLGARSESLEELAGTCWTTKEAFEGQAFLPTKEETRWLVLPHPSGLSRTMNDPSVYSRVTSALATHMPSKDLEPKV